LRKYKNGRAEEHDDGGANREIEQASDEVDESLDARPQRAAGRNKAIGDAVNNDGAAVAVDQTRQRLESDERREQILVAAQRIFAQSPYDGVSLNEIAASAGTTRTNIYYYFRTKRNLFLEVVYRFSRIPQKPDFAELDGESRDTLVRDVLGRWLDAVDQNREMFMTMLHASSSSDPQVSGVLTNSMNAWEEKLIAIVGLDHADPSHHAMVRSYQAMVSEATVQWLEHGRLSKGQVHRMLADSLLVLGRSAAADSGE
jgi:AcrR family transcriptional regulator